MRRQVAWTKNIQKMTKLLIIWYSTQPCLFAMSCYCESAQPTYIFVHMTVFHKHAMQQLFWLFWWNMTIIYTIGYFTIVHCTPSLLMLRYVFSTFHWLDFAFHVCMVGLCTCIALAWPDSLIIFVINMHTYLPPQSTTSANIFLTYHSFKTYASITLLPVYPYQYQ